MSGPLPALFAPLTVPASRIYGWIIASRNARYDRGIGVEPIERPVISVGNLTTGGTGKTPMVAWIAQRLVDAGIKPMIAMRGYRATAGQASDEQAEYAQRLSDVHVLANPDRLGALRGFLPQHPQVQCVLLDDGFQHRQIKRDLDLVLIDATSRVFQDRLLPAGNLREPVESLRRAGAVIVTHADAEADSEISNLKSQIERHHGRPPIAWCRHVWTHLEVFDRDQRAQSHEPSWLRGKRVLTMLGVGKPRSIIDQLEALGATIAVNVPAHDHEQYDQGKLMLARGLCEGCQAMIVTGKDWVKLARLMGSSRWPVSIVVPHLEIEFISGEQGLRQRVLEVAPGKSARE